MKIPRAVFIAFLAIGNVLHGASIIFGPATTISGDADVRTDGLLVAAFNLGFTGVTSTTINGVTFAPFPVGSGQNPVTVGNFTISETRTTLDGVDFYDSTSAPFVNLSNTYKSFLADGVQSRVEEVMVLTLGGLTIGQPYEVQLWTNFSSSSLGPFAPGPQLVEGADSGGSVILQQNTTFSGGGLGQFTVGTFMAGGTSQSINITGQGALPILNGFQLRAVPEPGSVLLLVLGAGGLLSSTRRRGRQDRRS